MSISLPLRKSEETRTRILEAALTVFRERGFARATMREVAGAAGVAVGAAYYYFPSKDAIVMAWYERAQEEMAPELERLLGRSRTLEGRVGGIIRHKLAYFAPNRLLLGALAAHMDPADALSPFSAETGAIRERDLSFFARAVEDSKVRLPKELAPYLPRLLWLYQMGILLFWVYDRSPEEKQTKALAEKSLKLVALLIRVGAVPLLKPFHRMAGDLLSILYGRP